MTIKFVACTVCSVRSVYVNYVFLGPRYSLGLLQPKRPNLAEGRKKPPVTNGDSTAICHQPATTPRHKSHPMHLSHDYRARNRGKPTIGQCALGVDRSRLVALVEEARVALGGNEFLLPNQLLTERAVPNAARVALPVKWAMHFPHDRNAARIFGTAA